MDAISTEAVVAVIGAGTMGAGIAQVAATAGHPVLLYDAQDGVVEPAIEAIAARMLQSVEKGRRTADEAAAIVSRLTACSDMTEFAQAGLVVEAIVESLSIKRAVLGEVEQIVGNGCIIATNTSSLSVTAIGRDLERPEQLAGMHFFNPAPVMALVEVIHGLATSDVVAETVAATATAWGKTPVHAISSPGFIGNRVARPFYGEALRLLAEGAADVATIDALIRDAGGFPMGPFELMDLVGIDVNLAVSRSVYEASGNEPRFTPSVMQHEMVEAGRLGRKTGRGFYDYGPDASKPAAATERPQSPPEYVTVAGSLGPADALVDAIAAAGLAVTKRDGDGFLVVGEARLAVTDGRTATERSAADGVPYVLIDLALDYETTPRIGMTVADQAPPTVLAGAVGLIQVLGKNVSVIDDAPGMVVMRTVAALANLAADTVHQGIATAEDVDTAMTLGFNYPRGPLAWGDRLGPESIAEVMGNLATVYGEDRYRVSPLVRRRALAGRSLSSPKAAG